MPKAKSELPKDQASTEVEKRVLISDRVVEALELKTNEALLIEAGEVESVVSIDGERIVVGNKEVL